MTDRLYISIDRSGDAPRYIASPDMHQGAEVWIPRDAVRVKPLEWEVYDDKRDGRTHYGHGTLSHWYAVTREKTGKWVVMHFVRGKRVQVHNKDGDTYPTLEAAKAAAQADYQARIMSALAALPAQPGAQEGE